MHDEKNPPAVERFFKLIVYKFQSVPLRYAGLSLYSRTDVTVLSADSYAVLFTAVVVTLTSLAAALLLAVLLGGIITKPLGRLTARLKRISGIAASLKKELSAKNAAGCAALFGRAISQVRSEPHEKSQALWLCTELYSTACDVLPAQPDATMRDGVFSSPAAGYERIKRLATRDDTARFLTAIGNELGYMLESGSTDHAETIRQVRRYVFENIARRITLHEAAERVCLSAGYLSVIYKKHCGETFVDFVNRQKIEKACELLRAEDCLIGQVSNMLSFENAYYFAKVFKRCKGVTPSEYRRGL